MAVQTSNQQSKTNRKLISVAEDYKDVWEALTDAEKYPNASRLVCEAVRFYLRHKDDGSIAKNTADDMTFLIRDIIREELDKMTKSSNPYEEKGEDNSEKKEQMNEINSSPGKIDVNKAVGNVISAISKFNQNVLFED